MPPAMIAPVIWPIPAAIAASPVGKSIKATQDEQPAKDGHKHRPSVRPAIVNAHNGKSSDEQEDTRHEDKRWVAGNLFRQLGERANVQQHAGSDCDKGGADQAGDRFRSFHPIGSVPGIPISCYSRELRSADLAQASQRSSIRWSAKARAAR